MEQSMNDVPQGSSPAASEGAIPQTQLPAAPVVTHGNATPPVGSQTPPENLYAALAEERRLRKEAEDKLNSLSTTDPSEPEVISDEAKILKGQLDTLSAKINQIEEEKALNDLCIAHPELKEHLSEFNEFRSAEHPKAKIQSVAKLFLAEKGLIGVRRAGLEQPTGGGRAPVKQGMTPEDVANLRKNDFKKYQELLAKGLLQMES